MSDGPPALHPTLFDWIDDYCTAISSGKLNLYDELTPGHYMIEFAQELASQVLPKLLKQDAPTDTSALRLGDEMADQLRTRRRTHQQQYSEVEQLLMYALEQLGYVFEQSKYTGLEEDAYYFYAVTVDELLDAVAEWLKTVEGEGSGLAKIAADAYEKYTKTIEARL